MKLAVSIAIVLVLALGGVFVAAELSKPAAAEPGAPVASPARASAEAGRADELLAQVAKVYRDAAAMTDTTTIRYATARGEQKLTNDVALGKGRDATVTVSGYRVTSFGDSLFVTLATSDRKYLQVPLGDDPEAAYKSVTNGSSLPMHLAMRWSEDADDQIAGLTLGQLRNARLAPNYGMGKDSRDQDVYEVSIEADNGNAQVHIDPERSLVTGTALTYTMTRGAQQRTMEMTISYEPRIHARLPEPIAFATAERFKVSSLDGLKRTAVGEPAPDFELMDLSGQKYTLADMQGQVVVLDFWATWCPPCRRGLPLLQQFHEYAVENQLPVRVFAVDVWEKHPTEDAKIQAVSSFWKKQGYTMPTLMDLDGTAVRPYGFTSIPHTVVIGPDGRVAAVHAGFRADMVNLLKKETRQLIGG